MGRAFIFGTVIGSFLSTGAMAKNVMKLYQVGQDGHYCVSRTKDASGCISGVGTDGVPVNLLDITKGNDVVFENLSDAPHDMRISGANADHLPAQAPNGPEASKQMNVADLSKQRITCSYHGDMLGFGYRVPEADKGVDPSGHQGSPGSIGSIGGSNVPPPQAIQNTSLSDVGKTVMAKGRPSEVAALVAKRPDLMNDLAQVRPALAQQVAAGVANQKGGPSGSIVGTPSALAQTAAGAAAGAAGRAGAASAAGAKGAAGGVSAADGLAESLGLSSESGEEDELVFGDHKRKPASTTVAQERLLKNVKGVKSASFARGMDDSFTGSFIDLPLHTKAKVMAQSPRGWLALLLMGLAVGYAGRRLFFAAGKKKKDDKHKRGQAA